MHCRTTSKDFSFCDPQDFSSGEEPAFESLGTNISFQATGHPRRGPPFRGLQVYKASPLVKQIERAMVKSLSRQTEGKSRPPTQFSRRTATLPSGDYSRKAVSFVAHRKIDKANQKEAKPIVQLSAKLKNKVLSKHVSYNEFFSARKTLGSFKKTLSIDQKLKSFEKRQEHQELLNHKLSRKSDKTASTKQGSRAPSKADPDTIDLQTHLLKIASARASTEKCTNPQNRDRRKVSVEFHHSKRSLKYKQPKPFKRLPIETHFQFHGLQHQKEASPGSRVTFSGHPKAGQHLFAVECQPMGASGLSRRQDGPNSLFFDNILKLKDVMANL